MKSAAAFGLPVYNQTPVNIPGFSCMINIIQSCQAMFGTVWNMEDE